MHLVFGKIQVLDGQSLEVLYEPDITRANTISEQLDEITFSKDGTVIDKGLFLLLSPGYSLQQFELSPEDGPSTKVEDGAFSIGAGLGLDIGVSDILTITPYVGGRYFIAPEWDVIPVQPDEVFSVLPDQDQLLQIFAGIRLGIRFDEQ